ncbi:MAG: hypothetical protein JO110_22405 [Acetobacteraceae bacterium]|nr:hypothetical protein [Acetobacteraceae bacterium]
MAVSQPALGLSHRLALIHRRAVRGGGGPLRQGSVLTIAWTRLPRLAARFEALAEDFRAGRVRAPPVRGWADDLLRLPGPPSLTPPRLPREFGWLLRLMPESAAYAGKVEHLLADPEMGRCWPGHHELAVSCGRCAGCWASGPDRSCLRGGTNRRPSAGCGPGAGCGSRLTTAWVREIRPSPRDIWICPTAQALLLPVGRARLRVPNSQANWGPGLGPPPSLPLQLPIRSLSTPWLPGLIRRRLCPGAALNRAERPRVAPHT